MPLDPDLVDAMQGLEDTLQTRRAQVQRDRIIECADVALNCVDASDLVDEMIEKHDDPRALVAGTVGHVQAKCYSAVLDALIKATR